MFILRTIMFFSILANFWAKDIETWSWVNECREYHKNFKGEKGVVCFFGDSISYQNECSAWAIEGQGKTNEDKSLLNWMHVHQGSMNFDYRAGWTKDGYWLTYCDMDNASHSYTSSSGITAYQYRDGTQSLPSIERLLDTYKPEIVLIMLGTNDLSGSTASKYKGDIEDCIKHILYEDGNVNGTCRGTIPIMSTIPTRNGYDSKVKEYNTKIKEVAQKYHLPFVDLYGEFAEKRPPNGSALLGDGVHPNGEGGGYKKTSDPYKNDGKALKYVGALLRCFVNFQKIKQVKYAIIDNIDPIDKNVSIQNTLLQSYPNPFNPECWIPYEIKNEGIIQIRIYNVLGQKVRELNLGQKQVGSYITKDKSAYWDGKDNKGKEVVSGVYYYELVVNSKVIGMKNSVILK